MVRYAETPVSWAMRKFRVSPVTGVEPNPPEISGVDDIKYTPQSPYWWHSFVLGGGLIVIGTFACPHCVQCYAAACAVNNSLLSRHPVQPNPATPKKVLT